ncbi:glycosyltransferase [Martelella endophytica]|uniref:Glycosyl transferase family 28 C-terminal domain-containing protein n=1 Tax=Martelella endophytica TaxID=1486262 RepID=A0A0D5LSP6_MAREN|nr:glycosyltransferase [Martelella endophytica]AJY46970.1 hypothetical protein TM49_16825 [Martelella endophytica]
MIFVAVGTQFPFDRMIEIIDQWAFERGVSDVVAQVGPSNFKSRAIKTYAYIDPLEFASFQRQAALLIGHAGMGTIIGALEMAKPLVIMPRLARFGEHRNDHQLATTQRFSNKPGIYVAKDKAEMFDLLDRRDELTGSGRDVSATATPQLLQALKDFIAKN